MGQQGKRLRQLANGNLPHFFQPVEPPFTLEEKMELDSPVEILDSLLFVAGVMLAQLILRAVSRVLALASVTITLSLEGNGLHVRTVRPALPTNDRQLWIKLMHLDLEAHPPPAAVLALTLGAEPGSVSKVQLGLFSPQLPEPSRLDVMPSTRSLGMQYSLSRGTVVEAFDQLQAEGYTRTEVGSGTYVASDLPDGFLSATRKSATLALPTSKAGLSKRAQQFLKDVEVMPASHSIGKAFRAYEPAIDLFPVELWARVASRVLRRAPSSALALRSRQCCGLPTPSSRHRGVRWCVSRGALLC
jgi:DNA-binding transcriptional regulator YhcF (GntR family)